MSSLPADIFRDSNPQPSERPSGNAAPEKRSISHERNIWEDQSAAREAIQRQELVRTQTEHDGLEVDTHWKLGKEESATRSLMASRGKVTERYDIEMSKEVASRLSDDEYQYSDACAGIAQSRQGVALAPIRFPCGGNWYTLRCPLAPETLTSLANTLDLAATATTDQIEKSLHFQFQRLYRKPPDEWTESEIERWDRLESYIDLEAYEAENPVPDNHIGVLVSISADQTVVRWNTDGETVYDTRHVHTALLTASEGWTVHAVIQRTAKGEQKWLSSSVEPLLKSNAQVLAEDIASPIAVSLNCVSDAHWPKIPRLGWQTFKTYRAVMKVLLKAAVRPLLQCFHSKYK